MGDWRQYDQHRTCPPSSEETVKESTGTVAPSEKPPLLEDTECLNGHHPEEEKAGGLEGLD